MRLEAEDPAFANRALRHSTLHARGSRHQAKATQLMEALTLRAGGDETRRDQMPSLSHCNQPLVAVTDGGETRE